MIDDLLPPSSTPPTFPTTPTTTTTTLPTPQPSLPPSLPPRLGGEQPQSRRHLVGGALLRNAFISSPPASCSGPNPRRGLGILCLSRSSRPLISLRTLRAGLCARGGEVCAGGKGKKWQGGVWEWVWVGGFLLRRIVFCYLR